MRHRVFGRKLNRDTNHRKALFKNLIVGLIDHSHIQTTEAKAKAIKGIVDKLITQAKQGTVHARRLLGSFLRSKTAVNKLVDDVAPRLKDRTSGYTRITRLGNRRGDSSMVVKLELVDGVDMPAQPKKNITKKSQKPSQKKGLTISQVAPTKGKSDLPKATTSMKAARSAKAANVLHRTQSKG